MAVEIHAASALPDTLPKPRRATERRGTTAVALGAGVPAPSGLAAGTPAPLDPRYRPAAAARASPAATDAARASLRRSLLFLLCRAPSEGATISPESSFTTSPALAKRSAGSRSRQRRMADSQAGSRSTTCLRGGTGASVRRRTAMLMAEPPSKGRRPVVISYITIAERVEVGGGRQLLALHLLGRHVGGGADDHAGVGDRDDASAPLLHVPRQAEVGDHRPNARARAARGHEDHVRALEVAVDDPLGVGGVEPGRDLRDDREGLGRRDPPRPRDPLRERLPREQLHGQEQDLGRRLARRPRAVEAEVEDAADVRVRDLAGELDLAHEAVDGLRVLRDLGPDGLERHPLAQAQVLRLVDRSHRALGDEPQDAVALGQHVAGRERQRPRVRGRTLGGALDGADRQGVLAGRGAVPPGGRRGVGRGRVLGVGVPGWRHVRVPVGGRGYPTPSRKVTGESGSRPRPGESRAGLWSPRVGWSVWSMDGHAGRAYTGRGRLPPGSASRCGRGGARWDGVRRGWARVCCWPARHPRARPSSPRRSSATFPTPGGSILGLTWGDGSLWVADENEMIYRLSPTRRGPVVLLAHASPTSPTSSGSRTACGSTPATTPTS